VSVEVKLGVPEDGLKLAVAPEGRPEVDRLTVLAKPPIEVMETVAPADPPCTTEPEVGLTLMVKSGTTAAVTVKVQVVVWVFPPPVPVMVIEYVPAGVVEAVEIVSVELKLGVPLSGEKLAVASDGRLEADKLTVPLKPPTEPMETVALVDPPCTTEPEVGLTLMVKSGAGGATYVVAVIPLPPITKVERWGRFTEK